jgi:two-component system nitrate/nitrite response regulator NarL
MSSVMHVSILGKSEIIREGLRRILIEHGFVVDSAEISCADFGELMCDVIIVDAHDIEEGIQSCLELHARFPECRIVLMMDQYRIVDVARAFTTGAVDGYLIKAISCAPLACALRLIGMGEKVLPSEVAVSLAHLIPRVTWSGQKTGISSLPLSNREVDILGCLVDGDPNKVISQRLRIADATVKVHIKAILRKLNVQNRTQAAMWAASRGLPLLRAKARRELIAAPMQSVAPRPVARAS